MSWRICKICVVFVTATVLVVAGTAMLLSWGYGRSGMPSGVCGLLAFALGVMFLNILKDC